MKLYNTVHRLFFRDAREMVDIEDQSIDLVVTSPPYPLIGMWDEQFFSINPAIKTDLESGDYLGAFEAMHRILDGVWLELKRVMKDGAFACINIGDAARTVNKIFQIYANHARIQHKFQELGFITLPLILWRKQTNAPNKFMGSGMLPAGAYVTLEHEYILIFRKGPKRLFDTDESKYRRVQSSFFWEERNVWFSDLWDFKGVRQDTYGSKLRSRSGAFPMILPFRLINMYSLIGDTVLDPFMGTGTTLLAAMAAGRDSIGYEFDESFSPLLQKVGREVMMPLQQLNIERIIKHLEFVRTCREEKKELKYVNSYFGFPVMTAQERDLKLVFVKQVEKCADHFYKVSYFNDQFIQSIPPEALSPEYFDPDGLLQESLDFEQGDCSD